jgi:hypothetical protein
MEPLAQGRVISHESHEPSQAGFPIELVRAKKNWRLDSLIPSPEGV